jgi:Zn finger protein HypA/HybF involved in hydrogenase expression
MGHPHQHVDARSRMQNASYTISADGRSITCHHCGMTSYNRNDIAQRYCGHCHLFHDDHTKQLSGS